MAWLNLNDSINNLKGQITNFANNVLADENEDHHEEHNCEALKKLCEEKEIEIQKLKQVNEELIHKLNSKNDGVHSEESWSWGENQQSDNLSDAANLSDLRRIITNLENEKQDLLTQLEQLDSDNQENLFKVVTIRNELQKELAEVRESYRQLKEEYSALLQNDNQLEHEVQELREKILALQKLDSSDNLEEIKEKNNTFLVDNQKTRVELEEARKELSVLKSSSDTLHKVFEDYKHSTEKECEENVKTITKLEGENRIIYSELQKAKEMIKSFEQKSIEDEENCKKLAIILDTYEQEVSALKLNLEELQAQNEQLARSASGRMDVALEEELENIQSSHQAQLKLLQDQMDNLRADEAKNEIDVNKFQELEMYVKELEEGADLLRHEMQTIKTDKEKLEKNLYKMERDKCSENEKLLHKLSLLQQDHDKLYEENSNLKNEIANKRSCETDTTNEFTTDSKGNDLIDNDMTIDIQFLQDENNKMRTIIESSQKQFESQLTVFHKKYINIIAESLKKFQDCDDASRTQNIVETTSEDGEFSEFSKYVQNIFSLLHELRCKAQVLQSKVFDLNEEKTRILTEKNHEIEKLIQNSEILSQEVMNKTKTIKDYENEINEMAKNNELLIGELEIFKNNSGLQTISESNEDNMVLLEAQLENANKRIEDLERIIDDFDNQQKIEDDAKTRNSCENDQAYQDLFESFQKLQTEYENLKCNYETAKKNVDELSELKINFEKMKTEYENMEYQLSEFNINAESLREEMEQHKEKANTLLKENDKLKKLYEDGIGINEDLKAEVNRVKEKLMLEEASRGNLEIEIRNLTDKLKNAKMTETTLKLQYDTVSKDLSTTVDAKNNLELSLQKVNQDLAQFQNNFLELQSHLDKSLQENEELKNALIIRDDSIAELKTKLDKVENIAVDENVDLLKNLTLSEVNKKVVDHLQNSLHTFENIVLDENNQKLQTLSLTETDEKSVMDIDIKDYNDLKSELETVTELKNKMEQDLMQLPVVESQLAEALQKCALLQQQLQEISNSRNELINLITTKHQESVTYHNEIQRLSTILMTETEKCRSYEIQLNQLKNNVNSEELTAKNNEIEKLSEQNSFLKEKCEVMAKNLLEEQAKVQQLISERSTPTEKEISLQKNLDRLQAHLIELEDHYTQELLQLEKKNAELQAKMNVLEEREKSSSNMYTSVSIRANQQVESLQNQLQSVTNERDSLRRQISDADDNHSKQAAALANLQFVLEQFRRDKEKDVQKETERIRRQINVEKQVQEDLRKEIVQLKNQLDESNQGLLAATRLSDQLEVSNKSISMLKEEVNQLQKEIVKKEEEIKSVASQTDGKVDKSLVKNLIIGFLSSNPNSMTKDQTQILKIIATVLDFNQQEHDKVNLNKQSSWLSSFLSPQSGQQQNMTQESLSQAFIKFLENESKPRVVPSLLNSDEQSVKVTASSGSTSNNSRQSPVVLSEIVLPTFSDFAQNRNSSSILKDVLKDTS